MPGTTDSAEYEHFDYKLYDQDPMELEDAIKKASEMRGKDSKRFHRVVPANREGTKFHVDSVPVAEAQANMWAKFVATCVSYLMQNYLRRNG